MSHSKRDPSSTAQCGLEEAATPPSSPLHDATADLALEDACTGLSCKSWFCPLLVGLLTMVGLLALAYVVLTPTSASLSALIATPAAKWCAELLAVQASASNKPCHASWRSIIPNANRPLHGGTEKTLRMTGYDRDVPNFVSQWGQVCALAQLCHWRALSARPTTGRIGGSGRTTLSIGKSLGSLLTSHPTMPCGRATRTFSSNAWGGVASASSPIRCTTSAFELSASARSSPTASQTRPKRLR